MVTNANHLWKPSATRTVVLDSFVPVPRGTTVSAPTFMSWPAKDPNDVLDYKLDISAALVGNDGDLIKALDVTVTPGAPGDLVMTSSAADGATAVMWLAGGQAGTVYNVTVVIGMSSGRVLQRSVLLPVLQLSNVPIMANAILAGSGLVLTDQNGNPVLVSP